LRAHLVQRGPARIEPSRTDDASAGIADEDAQALAEMLQVLASSRNRDQAVLLGRIDRALRKLDAAPEEFGSCEECEEEIDPRRLAILPYASKCAACQAKAEPRFGPTRRTLGDRR
jgi:DnaK suppressor protein